jgi:uroporphyrinogen-III synthase
MRCVPAIEITPPADLRPLQHAAQKLAHYDWALFTSANAVSALFREVAYVHSTHAHVQIASVGPETEAALRALGLSVSVRAHKHHAEGLIEALREPLKRGPQRLLFPHASNARELVPHTLRAQGHEVDSVCAYASRASRTLRDDWRRALEEGGVFDAVFVTSAAIAEALVEAIGPEALHGVHVASISARTTSVLEARGVRVAVTAAQHSFAGILAASVPVLLAGQVVGS